MGLFDLFRPKWKHDDPSIRREAIEQLTSTRKLLHVVLNDSDFQLRLLAVGRIDDYEALESFVEKHPEINEGLNSEVGSHIRHRIYKLSVSKESHDEMVRSQRDYYAEKWSDYTEEEIEVAQREEWSALDE